MKRHHGIDLDPGGGARVTAALDAAGLDAAGLDVVVLTIPASGAFLSVLRTATAGLAARLDFTLDEIEDLRIAVDEACGMLLPPAGKSGELRCEFRLDGEQIEVDVSVPAGVAIPPNRDSFAWTVLTALAGDVISDVVNDRQTIRLTKRRSRA